MSRSGLTAYLLADGRLICVECDVYPPNSQWIYRSDTDFDREASCDFCGRALGEVSPAGGRP